MNDMHICREENGYTIKICANSFYAKDKYYVFNNKKDLLDFLDKRLK